MSEYIVHIALHSETSVEVANKIIFYYFKISSADILRSVLILTDQYLVIALQSWFLTAQVEVHALCCSSYSSCYYIHVTFRDPARPSLGPPKKMREEGWGPATTPSQRSSQLASSLPQIGLGTRLAS